MPPNTIDRRRCRAAGGFTLVELAVTVAVLGILVAVAVPSMAGFVRLGRLTGAAEELAATLQLARSEAVRRNRPVTVCGAVAGSDDCVAGTSWAQVIVRHDVVAAGDPRVMRRYEVPEGLQVESSANRIRFRPSGTVSSQQTLSACLPTDNPAENIRVLTVLLGGGVVISKDDGGGAC